MCCAICEQAVPISRTACFGGAQEFRRNLGFDAGKGARH